MQLDEHASDLDAIGYEYNEEDHRLLSSALSQWGRTEEEES
jgi:hypothetical protein